MAFMVPFIPLIATAFSAVGQMQQGKAAKQAAEFQAGQTRQQAGQERAASQRAAIEERRQAQLANSRLQNLAGGGGSDPTIVNLAEGIAGEGEYRALTALYQGEERARGLETGAGARSFEGSQAQSASYLKAAGTIFGSVPTLMDRYGKGGYNGYSDMESSTGSYIRGRR